MQGQWLDEAHPVVAQQVSQPKATSPCQPAHGRQLPEDCSSPESATSSRMQSADGSPRTHVVCRICDCTVFSNLTCVTVLIWACKILILTPERK